MTSGCATFLPVFLLSQIPKLTFTEPIHVLLVFAKDVRRKDRQQGSTDLYLSPL